MNTSEQFPKTPPPGESSYTLFVYESPRCVFRTRNSRYTCRRWLVTLGYSPTRSSPFSTRRTGTAQVVFCFHGISCRRQFETLHVPCRTYVVRERVSGVFVVDRMIFRRESLTTTVCTFGRLVRTVVRRWYTFRIPQVCL